MPRFYWRKERMKVTTEDTEDTERVVERPKKSPHTQRRRVGHPAPGRSGRAEQAVQDGAGGWKESCRWE